MKRLITCLFLILHLVCAGQILNGSFENWTFRPDAGSNEQQWALADWQHLSPLGDSLLSLFGTYRDTASRSGDYALRLSRWYNYTYDVARFRNACPAKPGALSGYYRYDAGFMAVGKPDTAQVAVFLTRFNPVAQTTDTIGAGVLDLPKVDSFTFFQCPVTYFQSGVFPDSVTVILQPTKFETGSGGCDADPWCSFLTVDDIALSFSTPVPEPPAQQTFRFFPNPVTDRLTIKGEISGDRVLIFNVLGQLQFDERSTADVLTIDLDDLKSGLYLLKIKEKIEVFVRK